MLRLAFYHGRSSNRWWRMQDAAIRLATRGRYSHVELVLDPIEPGQPSRCLSSSGRDGGVREKSIFLTSGKWDVVSLNIDPDRPVQFIRDRIGAGYDYTGLLLSHVLALGRHDESRWFCSEIVGAAIGMAAPQRLSPQLLFDVVTWGRRCGASGPERDTKGAPGSL